MFAECFIWIGLGEHISWLIFAVNGIDRNLASINVVLKVVVLNVDVFGHGGKFDGATVVFKNPAVDGWLSAAKPKT